MIDPQGLLSVHAGATLFMVGVIWTVQVVHYPLMADVGESEFPAYERRHMRLITLIVGPAMAVELGSALLLVAAKPGGVPEWSLWAGLGLVVALWLSTGLIQGPAHVRLARWRDPRLLRRLVNTNWARTAMWTARGVLSLCMLRWGSAA